MQNENSAIWFVDRHSQEGRGEKIAFREAAAKERSITYGELSSRSALVAGAFEKTGIKRESRIACLLLDQIEYVEVFWGALKAGVVPVALNTLLATSVYDIILRDSRANCLIVSIELWPVVEGIVGDNPYIENIIVVGDETPHGTISYDTFMSGAEERSPVSVNGDECAFWLYSSGSTGQPKGVRHVHSSMKATADTFGEHVLGINETDIVYSAAKIFFAYGLGNTFSFPMSVGATSILFNGRPTPEVVVQIIERHEPTIFCGVPTLYAAMLAYLEQDGVPASKLRICVSAGEALPADIGNTWRKLWDVDIIDGVGSTEMLHIFLSNRQDNLEYGTSGIAVPGYELRCVNEAGEPIQPGEIGELLVKGASAADGYWNQRQKSRTTFEGEWTRTGDKYEITESGRYIYCGRTDDMFKVSGIWVSPFEVEQALIEHSNILEAAVVPVRDSDDLEKPKAFVVLQQNADSDGLEEVLKESVKEKIGKWKYPRWIEFVDDLPKTATGKIQRFKLRDMA